ncbi:CAP domain-containing protein [Pelagovum pacificum]|uniref:CAP domain-containing protein n=1 Tax=Pelagovum pacificum TaxID=2588711 RepID=A0A5C5GGX3_9RHOB|nr:CAP domain-containing protein [Pelagovum pacificum]QQA42843.1 CAP domain-containing protein [Pelagovum pacificum]TNY34008.1 CAP domain-containing protein [Pelagovum pacificum]
MDRRNLLIGACALLASGCGGGGIAPRAELGPDGLPLPQVYRISTEDAGEVQARMLEGVNSVRAANGVSPIVYDDRLNSAAASHSRDMAVQNRPWHFGSDGSSPLDRARRFGYPGLVLGQNISETYETELETLGAWMQAPDTRETIVDPRAREMGFSWFQEPAGKIWWTLVIGNSAMAAPRPAPNPAAVVQAE